MKLSVTTSAIEAYADALASEGLEGTAARLRYLLKAAHGFGSKPLAEFLAVLDQVELARGNSDREVSSQSLGDALRSLRNLEHILRKTSTHNRIDDFTALLARLGQHESATISELLEAVKVQRRGGRDGGPMNLKTLAESLKDALGDDERFIPLFEQLCALDAASVAVVTNALMSSGSSKSRKKDLGRIRSRHDALRTLNAKERAMAGKSAA